MDYKGFTFMISGGSYGGFYIKFRKTSWRICLGWVAFTLIFMDFESLACDVIADTKEVLRFRKP